MDSEKINVNNNSSTDQTVNSKSKKGKFLIIFIVCILIAGGAVLAVHYINENKTPEYITSVNGQNVLNVDAKTFKEKLKQELKTSMGMDILESSIDGNWLQVYEGKRESYVYGQIHFSKQFRANLISIEEYQGKVKSITWLYSTDSIPVVVSDDIINRNLRELGINYQGEQSQKQINKYFDISSYTKANVVENRGFFDMPFYTESEANMIVQQFRREFSIPYPYNNPERGTYIVLKCK